MDKILTGVSIQSNKQLSSENAWSEIERKGAGAFGKWIHINVKAPILFSELSEGEHGNVIWKKGGGGRVCKIDTYCHG